MLKAETDNPCDRNGAALRCERCQGRARHRRNIPYRFRRDLPGFLWKMGLNGVPERPWRRQTTEALCEECYKNWQYGPNAIMGSEVGRVVVAQLARGDMFLPHLAAVLGAPESRIRDVLIDLELEGTVKRIGALLTLGLPGIPKRLEAGIVSRRKDLKEEARRAMEIDDIREAMP